MQGMRQHLAAVRQHAGAYGYHTVARRVKCSGQLRNGVLVRLHKFLGELEQYIGYARLLQRAFHLRHGGFERVAVAKYKRVACTRLSGGHPAVHSRRRCRY